MPIYEFKCQDCGKVREELLPINAIDIQSICPNCGGISQRILSQSVFSVKGFNAKNGYAGSNKNDA
jgi:putative FmdB family regulatory protein